MLCYKRFPFESSLAIVNRKPHKEQSIYNNKLDEWLNYLWRVEVESRPNIEEVATYL